MDFDATKLHPETSKVLYLIRGVPGSGKSTLARILQASYHTDDWYEADMYFERGGGEYHFDPKLLQEAHGWCQSAVSKAMGRGSHCIIVSNTFTRQWELDKYREMGQKLDYKVVEIICTAAFDNVHGVPDNKIMEMCKRFEYV